MSKYGRLHLACEQEGYMECDGYKCPEYGRGECKYATLIKQYDPVEFEEDIKKWRELFSGKKGPI